MNEENEVAELLSDYYESWFKINEIYRIWSKKHGIQDTVMFILYVIEVSPCCSQNEICDKLCLPKQTVSLILSRLEKKGYISRKLDPEDRRNKVVSFTEQGSKYAKEILEQLKASEVEALSNMSQEQRRTMVESFCLLSDLLTKSLSK
ncbi:MULTISPECIES: MarR family winged helix-turn-helix transcriptional regulator [Clostridium]|uniref:HTH-type transcriptional regulator MhqR n=2 Tax=Clostridium TaxID=1485 RepID=D8GTG0_CLOLD|nr:MULTISPECIES: MarR family transcriptional regulator [Clostridium]ADK14609.1 predicted transcriptional regulator, marR family [Clostridium ljungdahlii DSM 13528]AGY77849.1 MarR family transcriptional regulator [Clostridium autoethanogenum DSM 10061]ALU37983.1 Transcriptional regulator MarR family [Clostridium autoethanogenum DSM 10061]OAA85846.1 HTH-type transcriptional regulator MhqR [Clostridium ljungdahlii DSM 13528]OVY50747.1 HTH-type transcriptional regulator MhqR [Clostridium autoethan